MSHELQDRIELSGWHRRLWPAVRWLTDRWPNVLARLAALGMDR